MSSLTDDQLAQVLWDFNVAIDDPKPADIILVLGSHDVRVAHRGIELYKSGYAPLLMFSGGLGRLTDKTWALPEADMFAREAINAGISEDKILKENKSTNTGENISFSLSMLNDLKIQPNSFLLVQKPYMLRRALATFKRYIPDSKVSCGAPQLSFQNYPNEIISKNDAINIMVGDIQRLKLYPSKGFQVEVPIPNEVWSAYLQLVERGYVNQLITE